MKCPKCNLELLMSERANTQIDYCPSCRGIWLERGNLDVIIDRSFRDRPTIVDDRNYERDNDLNRFEGGKENKRRSFLSDLFD